MKKANILATAALATLLAACSNDSDVLNTPDYADCERRPDGHPCRL